jgi:hypothetical protein
MYKKPLLVSFALLCFSGCQSLDSLSKANEPDARASWEKTTEIDKPFYAYKTEGGRASVRITRDNVAIATPYGGGVPVIAIGNTRVTKADGSSQSVTIYQGISPR